MDLKKHVRDLHLKALLFLYHFFNFKVALLSRVFTVNNISLERRKKIENPGDTIGVPYISDIISIFHENWPNISQEKILQRSHLKPKHSTRKSDLKFFGVLVFVYINIFPLHTSEGCHPIALEQAIWHCFVCWCRCMPEGKGQTQFVRS